MAQPPLVLEPPAPLPAPPGLFSVAEIEEIPIHGRNFGAIWLPDTCGPGEVYAAPCQTPPYPTTVLDGIEKLAMAFPFTVYASLVTGALGIDHGEAVRRVKQRLLNNEQIVAERAFWGTSSTTVFTGVPNYAGKTPDGTPAPTAGAAGGILQNMASAGAAAGYLNGGDTSGATNTIADAMSMLEELLAQNYYGMGIIHARPRCAAYLAKQNQIRVTGLPKDMRESKLLYSQNLNCINLGNGYSGTGPANDAIDTPAGTEYMWATGRIRIWRDADVSISDSQQLLNKVTNQLGVYAWRTYMIGVECFAAVVKAQRA